MRNLDNLADLFQKRKMANILSDLRSLEPLLWLKCQNLPNCTKFCSTHKLEVAGKWFVVLTKNYLMDWQIRGLKDGILGNILAVYSNL